MLLAISNDFSLRTLKMRRWKSLQRWTYAAFALTAAHGIAYQLIEKRYVLWVLVFALVMSAIAAGQIFGFVQVQRRTNHRLHD
jgi:sulfoxide reductase heme-binding subunit YedZ